MTIDVSTEDPVVVIYDGHRSHFTHEVLLYAQERGIRLVLECRAMERTVRGVGQGWKARQEPMKRGDGQSTPRGSSQPDRGHPASAKAAGKRPVPPGPMGSSHPTPKKPKSGGSSKGPALAVGVRSVSGSASAGSSSVASRTAGPWAGASTLVEYSEVSSLAVETVAAEPGPMLDCPLGRSTQQAKCRCLMTPGIA